METSQSASHSECSQVPIFNFKLSSTDSIFLGVLFQGAPAFLNERVKTHKHPSTPLEFQLPFPFLLKVAGVEVSTVNALQRTASKQVLSPKKAFYFSFCVSCKIT